MIQVTEHIWRGPRPKDIRALVELGFKRIINLQSGTEEALTDSKYEVQSAVSDLYGIDHIRIPMSGFTPPSDAAVSLATQLLTDPVKTYVHCHHGVDRTGFVIEAYLMTYEGKTYDQARADWKKHGRHWWFSWWERALSRWKGSAG